MEKKHNLKNNIFTNKYLIKNALKYKKELFWGNLNALFSSFFLAIIPLLFPFFIDGLLLGKENVFFSFLERTFSNLQGETQVLAFLLFVGGLLFILRILSVIFQFFQEKQFSSIAKANIAKMRKVILNKIKSLPIHYYENTSGGKITSFFITDLNTIDEFISLAISRFIISLFQIISVLLIIFVINFKIALAILFFYPILMLLINWIGIRIKYIKKRENTLIGELQEESQECIHLIRQLKCDNRFSFFEKRINKLIEKIQTKSYEFFWKSRLAAKSSFTVFLVTLDFLSAFIILLIFKEELTLGNLLALTSYFWILSTPSLDIFDIQYAYQNASAALSRINEFMESQDEKNLEARKDFKINKKSLAFENVCFEYIPNKAILKNLSFSIKENEKVALVGVSGEGKTTILKNILGIYNPLKGDIKFGGISYKDLGYKKIRERVAIAFQKPLLFNGTIAENICLGESLEEEKIWKALELTQLKNLVEKLPHKLQSVVGKNGVKLSAGQIQRLSIAKVILKDADLYIFDEATSAVDNETEDKIYNALSHLLENKMVLTISHYAKTIKRSHKILVLQNGTIIQEGTFEKLINENGLYKTLFA